MCVLIPITLVKGLIICLHLLLPVNLYYLNLLETLGLVSIAGFTYIHIFLRKSLHMMRHTQIETETYIRMLFVAEGVGLTCLWGELDEVTDHQNTAVADDITEEGHTVEVTLEHFL